MLLSGQVHTEYSYGLRHLIQQYCMMKILFVGNKVFGFHIAKFGNCFAIVELREMELVLLFEYKGLGCIV